MSAGLKGVTMGLKKMGREIRQVEHVEHQSLGQQLINMGIIVGTRY